ncbi:MAG: hypothetical protein HC872_08205 [Gammaproteobacteria bacterium]|nr:hypothetical protein [Gammaproteobacteria bacterium]
MFGNFPELDYVAAVRSGTLPANIEVIEFFLETGAYLDAPYAQQHYLSANYTHVARAVLEHGVNLVAQLVATRQVGRAHAGEPVVQSGRHARPAAGASRASRGRTRSVAGR